MIKYFEKKIVEDYIEELKFNTLQNIADRTVGYIKPIPKSAGKVIRFVRKGH